eukprot:scaffold39147_cov55-Attheya_sp.AAC.5
MQLTAGGDRLPYDGKKSTETAGLETTKILINRVMSTPGARFACFDIGNMYLNTKLPSPKFMKIHQSLIPQEVMDEYNVEQFLDENGYVYVEITRAIYGLAQSGYLANQDLIKNLAPCGYYPSKRTPGLWHHKTRLIGVKYEKKEDVQHLLDSIAAKYPVVKADWTGSKYIGIDLDWNYEAGEVKLSMKGYVQKALKEFLHHPPPQTSQRTNTIHCTRLRQNCSICTNRRGQNIHRQTNPTCPRKTKGNNATAKALDHFMNYCATHPDAEIIYRRSNMILQLDSDAAYLVAPKARSRAAGFFYLGKKDGSLFNGPIFILTKIIQAVISSAAEAKCAGLYLNAHESAPMRTTLIELGHPQPKDGTPIRTDNSTASEQGQFRFFWAPGKLNLADYHTKKHPASHHTKVRPIYLYIEGKSPSLSQGCDKILTSGNTTQPRALRALQHVDFYDKLRQAASRHSPTAQTSRADPRAPSRAPPRAPSSHTTLTNRLAHN